MRATRRALSASSSSTGLQAVVISHGPDLPVRRPLMLSAADIVKASCKAYNEGNTGLDICTGYCSLGPLYLQGTGRPLPDALPTPRAREKEERGESI
jgi:hypothetical protein